jgi:hypothetical protein
MPKYPNQLKITIKRTPASNYPPFTQVSQEVSEAAMRDLKGSGFKLWYYLCGNCQGFELDLSKAHYCKVTGESESSYRRAKAELMEKGYLVQKEACFYEFIESPFHERAEQIRDNVVKLHSKENVKKSTGKTHKIGSSYAEILQEATDDTDWANML